jgi:Na+/melibiose symporter-like transporter
MTYALIGLAGFDPGLGSSNSVQALDALRILFVGGPVLLTVLAAFTLFRYPLDEKKQAELAAAIAARRRPDEVTPAS